MSNQAFENGQIAELELGLHRRVSNQYTIEPRFLLPDSEVEIRLDQRIQIQLTLDLDHLAQLSHDPQTYSQTLTERFFADNALWTAFEKMGGSAASESAPLRMRLYIGPSAPELHGVRWELLRDPVADQPLFTSQNLLFSRYISSPDFRRVKKRAKGDLSSLVMVANPVDLADWRLAPVDAPGEIARAREGLGEIPLTVLPEEASNQPVTLNALTHLLREKMPDILYLTCHGALMNKEPILYLENQDGKVKPVKGSELITRLNELEHRPRLVVLASCDSAKADSGDAFAALGPRLAESGIPAVLAMQGQISMQTVAAFMPVFFRELQQDGRIDRAVAVARGEVREHDDHWMIALYMRLKSGRIWYVPGFSDDKDEFQKWQSLAGFIQEKSCTPILGPSLPEILFGSRRALAAQMARAHGFPMNIQYRDQLPRVAQYIMTSQRPGYAPIAFRAALRDALIQRHETVLSADLLQTERWSAAQVNEAILSASQAETQKDPDYPYRLLAELRLPLYITTEINNLLFQELERAGVYPKYRICPWNKWIPQEKSVFEEVPTEEVPLIYHLFGHTDVPRSVVYSEDNYLDYLIGVSQNKKLIPSAVRARLSNTSLLFLGFQIEDWEFRVLFRYLMAQESRELLKDFTHAVAQIEPDEERLLDVRRTLRYLEEYFKNEHIEIFWGTAKEFLQSLRQHL